MADSPEQRPRPGAGAGGRQSSSGRRRRRRRSGGSGSPGTAQRAKPAAPGARKGAPNRSAGGRSGSKPRPARPSPSVLAHPVPESPVVVAPVALSAGNPLSSALGRAVTRNRRRALGLCLVPAVVVLAVAAGAGAALGASAVGLVVGAVLGALGGAGLWRGSGRVVLRSLRARPVDEEDVPGPFTQTEWLCATMGLPLPALYLVDDDLPDALAVGRSPSDAALVLTTGLLDALDPVGVEGVLAHELAHLKRHDSAPATVAAALALMSGAGGAGAGAAVHRLAGRGREFEADRMAVQATRYPPGLRQALATLTDGAAPTGLSGGSRQGLPERRVGQVTRWLFTVVLPDRAGRRAEGSAATGELDAPSVRIAALDEW